ncbi:YciI family protein [Acidiphilium sp. AL]|uniref:YciI family protein n=1 Tax=Acidiphilium iwatense TaxID=768198 RepID=A0ABS9DRW1_9PROT|nr:MULTISPECIES: YciI family protein [Acidiphilium]MCF3945480.1 YciI family protein [Acidiphilium iwatense]MCU4158995.1 YciI family protein [Acidiphilium sp. AL]
MQFILIAHDRDGGLALRKQIRPDHLAYLTEIAGSIVFGGPLIDDAGDPCGSMIVYEAPDRAAAEALIANDPYSRANLFGRTEIRAFRTVVRDGRVTA